MTDAPAADVRSATVDRIGRLGLWYFTDGMAAADAVGFAQRVEGLGYGALWIPETVGRDPFAHAAALLAGTDRLTVATGIANIHHRHPGAMKQAAWALGEQAPGRFMLGIGVSHQPLVEGLRKLDYSKPVTTMRSYLEDMEASPYRAPRPDPAPPRLLAALGPKMLELAAGAADGAHPYWTTPEHTAKAREVLGADKLLCVEQKVVLSTDPAAARASARAALAVYSSLPNYVNNWFRLGFDQADLADGGSDRLVDSLVAWGDEAALARRVQDHLDAGADHVCIQPLDPGGRMGTLDWSALEALAPGA